MEVHKADWYKIVKREIYKPLKNEVKNSRNKLEDLDVKVDSIFSENMKISNGNNIRKLETNPTATISFCRHDTYNQNDLEYWQSMDNFKMT